MKTKKSNIGIVGVVMMALVVGLLTVPTVQAGASVNVTFLVFDPDGALADSIEIKIYDTDGDLIDTVETGENGTATTNLETGKYNVKINIPGFAGVEDDIYLTRNSTFRYDLEYSRASLWGQTWLGISDVSDAVFWAWVAWLGFIFGFFSVLAVVVIKLKQAS